MSNEEKENEKYAIISDVHSNGAAFRAVLDEIKNLNVKKICLLGDIVGYGADCKESVRLAQENCQFIVRGNHDEQVDGYRHPDMRAEAIIALDYAASTLSQAEIKWLKNLPDILTPDDRFVICHGALTHNSDYILTTEAALTNLLLLEKNYPGKNVAFFGHTHLPMALTKNSAKTNFVNGGKLALAPNKHYLINPGSIGQPRDKTPAASFVIYSTAEEVVTWHRVLYDVSATQESMLQADLPRKSWERIALGK